VCSSRLYVLALPLVASLLLGGQMIYYTTCRGK
jgi:hypothetical protein